MARSKAVPSGGLLEPIRNWRRVTHKSNAITVEKMASSKSHPLVRWKATDAPARARESCQALRFCASR